MIYYKTVATETFKGSEGKAFERNTIIVISRPDYVKNIFRVGSIIEAFEKEDTVLPVQEKPELATKGAVRKIRNGN